MFLQTPSQDGFVVRHLAHHCSSLSADHHWSHKHGRPCTHTQHSDVQSYRKYINRQWRMHSDSPVNVVNLYKTIIWGSVVLRSLVTQKETNIMLQWIDSHFFDMSQRWALFKVWTAVVWIPLVDLFDRYTLPLCNIFHCFTAFWDDTNVSCYSPCCNWMVPSHHDNLKFIDVYS